MNKKTISLILLAIFIITLGIIVKQQDEKPGHTISSGDES